MLTKETAQTPEVKATIREFADQIREQGISPAMMETEIAIAVERLKEEHGIRVGHNRIARLVAR